MKIISEAREMGVVERRFDLEVDGDTVPGIQWLPENPRETIPHILIGHGGTQHKRVDNVLSMGRKVVRELGYGVVALDAPGHGDRATPEQREAATARIRQRLARGRDDSGDRPPLDDRQMKALGEAAPKMVREWQALLDALQENPSWADGPFGYWGVSMGCLFGVPLLGAEPRISAAVLGLAGARSRFQLDQAAEVTQPLLFLFQAEDELMTIESGIDLFQAFGSTDKTLHMNPGGHVEIPLHERKAARDFYRRHFEGAGLR